MQRYTVTAEHTNGKSVGHCCTSGVYSDPTDGFEWQGQAANADAAEHVAYEEMQRFVADSDECECKRHLRAGSDAWWGSVAFTVQNEAGQVVFGEEDEVAE